MNSKQISSNIGSHFHPMISVLIVLFTIPLWASGYYVIAFAMVAIAMFLLTKTKKVIVQINGQRIKEGWFGQWKKLDTKGYISVFPEKESQIMRSRVNESAISITSVYVNYIHGKNKTHLYSTKSLDEAFAIAKQMNAAWNCGVYDGIKREWVEEQKEQ